VDSNIKSGNEPFVDDRSVIIEYWKESDIFWRVARSNPLQSLAGPLLGPCFRWVIAPTVNHVVVAAEDAREHEDVKVEYV